MAKPERKQPITKLSYPTTTENLAFSNMPMASVYTVNWDRPDFQMIHLRPRADGMSHRLPEGPGVPKRKGYGS